MILDLIMSSLPKIPHDLYYKAEKCSNWKESELPPLKGRGLLGIKIKKQLGE